ncbi:2-oxo-4-hydroxy-4-carboxy-5-ureidoimidazoline decarboxylase [Paenibacillus sp. N4]|uniref:2-oxo-4-hydroxy-4-carboxy-5-ureidoimidazoline decarboxylase n=1 Tax=Paenibacillus vietnamensis TaxID=2590547 RepID=UPI001CD0C3C9|nr:2-oxo-4-hydroxy-4-carboxy-5-ureidoimidazoline decarboxylase [Paenibacillus vietnamensis]MCA0754170.1 2-oxo-4-hydroxy-4-carboxy-5-ureidoimidazoline decarboxylase [Paenibacillus vietnamensis]
MKLTIEQINELSREQFIEALGAVFEHSPWVAGTAWACRPFGSSDELHEAMMNVVRESRTETIVDLFRAHPDLGTRLAVADYSAREQEGAGLDRLSAEEYEQFRSLNEAYVAKFGFPFILAVRGKTKEQILEAMTSRIEHPASLEAEQAMLEIGKITGFRLKDLING